MKRDSLVIRTPEGIEFALPLAGVVSRMLALLVDFLVIAAIGQLIRQVIAPLNAFGADVAGAVYAVGYFAVSMLYGAILEWFWRGQTVGKRLFGLRVVDARGLRLEPSQVIVRNILRLIDALPALYLVGGTACFFQRHRRRLGDIAAGTVVLRTPKLAHPDFDRILGGKYNSLAESRHLAARLRQKVSPETAQIALDALLRRDQLRPESRIAVFRELAVHFRSLVPYPADVVEQLSDEQYVRNVVEVVFGRTSAAPRAPTAPVR